MDKSNSHKSKGNINNSSLNGGANSSNRVKNKSTGKRMSG